jgi:hypothetical protein
MLKNARLDIFYSYFHKMSEYCVEGDNEAPSSTFGCKKKWELSE